MNYDMNMDTSVVSEESNKILSYTDANSDYQTIIDEMLSLINDLGNFWVSNSQVKTANELIISLNSLKELQSNINIVANTSKNIANMREQAEEKISKLLSSL